MADIISEILCFLKSYNGSTPMPSILTIINTHYSNEEVCKAKVFYMIYVLKYLLEDEVP